MALCSHSGLKAQQSASEYNTYMYNLMVLNPAYAGNEGALMLRSQYRSQWVGVDGAPEILNFSMDASLGALNKTGLGIFFSKNVVGPLNESSATLNYSHTLFLGSGVRMSFGLMGGLVMQNFDYSKIIPRDPLDGRLRDDVVDRIDLMGGVGFFLNNSEKWYMGVSLPNILTTEYYDDYLQATVDEKVRLYVMGGYYIGLGDDWILNPNILGRFVTGEPLMVNVLGNLTYNNFLTFGLSYRFQSNNALASMIGFQLSPNFMLGYSYDVVIGDLEGYGLNSHELFLRFSLGGNKKGSENPSNPNY